ncbi:hypothetical protein SESBI_40625 [Sesbania bispinosa]|nr:hypothetical protein SESBI_40625 [Sesbania bispinosa]
MEKQTPPPPLPPRATRYNSSGKLQWTTVTNPFAFRTIFSSIKTSCTTGGGRRGASSTGGNRNNAPFFNVGNRGCTRTITTARRNRNGSTTGTGKPTEKVDPSERLHPQNQNDLVSWMHHSDQQPPPQGSRNLEI